MDQSPSSLFFSTNLGFSALGVHGGTVFLELGHEVPIELRPCGVPVHMNAYVLDSELSLREHLPHCPDVEVFLNLPETALIAA